VDARGAGAARPPVGDGPGRVLAGTSGFAFPEWKGGFYPADLPNDRLLSHYASVLPTVEINVSFYRMPTSSMLAAWAQQTPETFRFALKAHRRITHQKRLRDVDDELRWLYERVTELGPRLGPVLFQLPPSLRKDVELLERFLAALPPLPYTTVEFRHASWHDDETYALLRRYRAAFCIAEDDDACEPLVHTAPFAYYRLHRLRYTDEQLNTWAAHLRGRPDLHPVFCYFTHETGPEAVDYASGLLGRIRGA
jgi:uncharacterized protein YecE (DUF72 family)